MIVWYFYKKWTNNSTEIVKATIRMTIQLLLIGYALVFLFETQSYLWGIFIILFMIIVSSFIALRNIQNASFNDFIFIAIAIAIGGSFNLILVLEFVLDLTPFYEPRYLIPLAGMIYANAMNAVSLSSERFEKEIQRESYEKAREISFRASLIPQINAFLAVGLVSLPGMMTGQILSGVDPIIAVRYQIVVMAMVMGSAGISVVLYLLMQKRKMFLETE
jgi:putative ABC transport system permease protein